ncbi:FAD-dependent tricarballylate dehydrogenase TcuA [Azospirillum rugosum]|uniref:Tricarballylate dehydrogenase n=1 Tax=Azospirillum rugosum TaxID=416170 RepID=A0ABS4SDN5_9PROT|nr:FAD-dependent tricarballylate dehydrogenase TcuA [Azospirillum rugosum]MBP2290669.1 tricarballylate dehydrogenase [Azospirillum rugosum]MDQ0525557.1 tricarballylate dehydrogenase [Azospirillum rugosum]
MRRCDVVVVGGGAAALCAAIAARRSGASVLLLESAPKDLRGGNARHSRNFRIMHDGPTPFIQGRYDADDYRSDLRRVTGGRMDETVADRLIGDSAGIVGWLEENGVRFQDAGDGNLPFSRKTAFFLGGGKSLVNALYATAGRLGVEVRYDSEVRRLEPGDGWAPSVTVRCQGGEQVLCAGAVVAASGGFQANRDWLRECWGAVADQIVTRGTPHATGTVLKGLLDLGAAPVGDAGYGHMVAVDARSPRFDGGIVTRLDGLAQGIVVDRDGCRFADEGSDIGPTRFSVWGDRIARCPGGVAFSIFDSAIERRFRPSIFPTIRAGSVGDLAVALGIAPEALERTVSAYNAAIRTSGGNTEGLDPPKSRVAAPIAVPPFGAYPVRAGLTSTHLGVRVDERARVLDRDGIPLDGIFAAGVIMAPNVIGRGYLAGIAMTIGAVFGRIAGREAAAHALR